MQVEPWDTAEGVGMDFHRQVNAVSGLGPHALSPPEGHRRLLLAGGGPSQNKPEMVTRCANSPRFQHGQRRYKKERAFVSGAEWFQSIQGPRKREGKQRFRERAVKPEDWFFRRRG